MWDNKRVSSRPVYKREMLASPLLAGLLTFFLAAGAIAQTSLPPEVQADILKKRIVDALRQEDVKTALAAFDQYHALKVKMPPPLMFLEAKAAWAAGDSLRAFTSLDAFLKNSPREGKQYNEAVALYPQYEAAARPALEKAKAEAAAKAKAEAEAAQKARVAAANAKAEAEARARAEAEAAAQAKAAEEAKAKAQAEAEAKAACATNPACNFEDLGSGVLKQVLTGLEWTQSDNGSDIDWNAAKKYCEGKTGGWRLPSVAELQSLYDQSGAVSTSCGRSTCKVSPLFRLTASWFRSNEKDSGLFSWEAESVNLSHGDRYPYSVSYSTYHRALCVRGS